VTTRERIERLEKQLAKRTPPKRPSKSAPKRGGKTDEILALVRRLEFMVSAIYQAKRGQERS
jgi:hypothetical protein